jgi:transposase
MALGKRTAEHQPDLFITTAQLPRTPGHVFYEKLNELLARHGFDRFAETACLPFYKDGGRPGIPPGVYFRMLLVGYFEGIDSQRGIAWRCADSLALRSFLGVPLTESTPDHSSLTRIRRRLNTAAHEQIFGFVLGIAEQEGLLRGKTLGVDSTTLEANAALKSIVRKETGEDYKTYLTQLAQAEGIAEPTAEDLQRFDRKRKDKTCSNVDWQSPSDPDAKIARMKDGTTHLAYKAEHAVDLESSLVVAARVLPADESDSNSLPETRIAAQTNLVRAGSEVEVQEAAADKGYHAVATLHVCRELGVRTYVPEKALPPRKKTGKPGRHNWQGLAAEYELAYRNNRRRQQGAKGKRLGRKRSELVERSFAHVCETGGMRRSWIRGLVEVGKRYLMAVAAFNLGTLLRKLFRMIKPKGLVGNLAALRKAAALVVTALLRLYDPWRPRTTRQLFAAA